MPQNAYKAICKDNQYLYAQLEQLTLLMGHATVNNLKARYDEYAAAKAKLKRRIDDNLERLDDLWNMSAREALRIPEWRHDSVASKVIELYIKSERKDIATIAIAADVSELRASRIITKYLTNKYDEVA